MQAPAWWAYGNLNFSLPQVNEICRIRVVYRVDPTGVDFESWLAEAQRPIEKPFHVRLTNNAQDQCFETPAYTESVQSYWDEAGWRVIDLYYNLPDKQTYLALTFDGKGLTCGSKVPFYLKEVSVVPVKLLNETHASGDVVNAIEQDAPEAVVVGAEDSINEIAVAPKAVEGIYDLQGRKVAKTGKGLYIINGVKTIVK